MEDWPKLLLMIVAVFVSVGIPLLTLVFSMGRLTEKVDGINKKLSTIEDCNVRLTKIEVELRMMRDGYSHHRASDAREGD